jgi:isopenicillin-N N-acyltransferase like protein
VTLPLIELSGTPFEQGQQHGEALLERIEHNLELYFYRFEKEAKLTRAQTLEMAAKVAQHFEKYSPEYAEGIRGIARAANKDFLEIAALNARYEILYYQYGEVGLENAGLERLRPEDRRPDGCTAFAVLPEAMSTGQLTIGQNWDWIEGVKGALLRTKHNDGLETLGFTEAGLFAPKLGLNSAKLGLCINGLTSMDDDWSRDARPTHARCWEILRSKDFARAQSIIEDSGRACSTNFLVAQAPAKAVDFETAPNGVRQLECSLGSMAHTNHFVDPKTLGIIEPPSERRPHSQHRQARMTALLESKRPLSLEDIQNFLRDRDDDPDGICRYPNPDEPPEDRVATICGVIMNLETCEMWITDGQPDIAPFEKYQL